MRLSSFVHSCLTMCALLLPLSLPAREAVKHSSAPQLTSMDVLDDNQRIKPGDRIFLRILEERLDTKNYDLPEDGMIQVPNVGPLKATGLTCKTLARLIQQKLSVLPPGKLPYSHSGLPTVVVELNSHIRSCGPDLSQRQATDATRLQPNWLISIRIVEDKREALQQIIARSGDITAPYIGLVKAAGLTTDELAAKVKTGLEKNFFKSATVVVRLEATQPPSWEGGGCFFEFHTVLGQVVRPGKYDFPMNHDQTVSAALKRAGGHTSSKPVPVIKIIRKTPSGNKTILVDASAVLVRKSKEHDLHLRDADVMIVE